MPKDCSPNIPKWASDTVGGVLGWFPVKACFEQSHHHPLWPGRGCFQGPNSLPPRCAVVAAPFPTLESRSSLRVASLMSISQKYSLVSSLNRHEACPLPGAASGLAGVRPPPCGAGVPVQGAGGDRLRGGSGLPQEATSELRPRWLERCQLHADLEKSWAEAPRGDQLSSSKGGRLLWLRGAGGGGRVGWGGVWPKGHGDRCC